ncbi:ELWxxDGT repeat protein [Polaribacter porphyrae]|uniref:Secretion system C-terminal sorting domain-containing protein n=1 Tax=Polaribacter porphyrae TaxID=1137780 RepID=A0A2S7WS85_9FLAO|nr:ELWxxDGT repeat protein [Polaribacter porphyrae]PQJ80458.1 hypothetical protein BTO18_15325 [Polaribacter porphyrae]
MQTKNYIILYFSLISLISIGQEIKLVKDISTGSENTGFGYFKEYNNKLIFYANTTEFGAELWISDGTADGTKLLKDINPGNQGSISTHAPNFVEFQNKLFFRAYTETHGYELWVTDGTENGTKLFEDINPGENGSFPNNFIFIDNTKMYFNATTQNHGEELWRTDGTNAGTTLLFDNYEGTVNGSPGSRIVYDGKIFFNVSNPTENGVVTSGNELRKLGNFSFDLVKDINSGSGSSNPTNFYEFNGKFYFNADDGTKGTELWVSNGTENGTNLVKDIFTGSSSSPSNFKEYNGNLYFTASSTGIGREIWKTDGSENGTTLLKDVNENGSFSVFLAEGVEYKNRLYFWGSYGGSGIQLWRTDGTANGTKIVKVINTNGNSTSTAQLKIYNDKLYFVATNDGINNKLWESDGTDIGTKIVNTNDDINLKNNADGSEDLIIVNNKMYFYGFNDTYGRELYVFDAFAGKTYVPDNNFEQALIDLGKDDVLDNYVITDNINTITFLNLENKNIFDITGVEDFSSLETFNVRNNNLSTLNIAQNTNLKVLYCSNNNLNSLDISNNIELTQIDFSDNNLNTIDFKFNSKLESITTSRNNLSAIDITKQKELDWLIINENIISEINLSFNPKLRILNAKNNRLNSVSIINNTVIESINLEDNGLNGINISGSSNIKTLKLTNNNLTSLDLTSNNLLENLLAKNNILECIQVSKVDNANTIWSNNVDANVNFSTDCSEIWTLNVDPTIQTILMSITGLDANNDGNITVAEAVAFTGTLDLSNKGITLIDGLQVFSSIHTLDLSGNSISDFSPFTGLVIEAISKTSGKTKTYAARSMNLENLILKNNRFQTINLDGLSNLKILDISNNQDLITVSFKNGNNSVITTFNSSNTPNLSCILVDNKGANYLSTWNKDAANNFVESKEQCRSEVLSTEELLQKDVTIFPNPVTNFLTIESTKEFDFVEIYNTIGKRIVKTNQKTIDFSKYTSGIYMMRIVTENKLLTKKIIKN